MGIPTLAITTPFCPLRASPSFSYSGANLLQCPHLQNINNKQQAMIALIYCIDEVAQRQFYD